MIAVIKKILLGIVSVIALLVAVVLLGVLLEFLRPPRLVNRNVDFVNRLKIPPLLEGSLENGRRVYELSLQTGQTEFFEGAFTPTLGANGSYLMPTIRATQGDEVEVRVTNGLDELTTMHWHGMHVPASVDGVHQIISPNETWRPQWQIRQEAATLWYHPHIMGATGRQVYNGLAGLFIIDDANSQSLAIPQDYGVNDFPLIVQDREFDANAQFVYRDNETDLYGHKGMHGDTLLVNGTYAPYLEVPAGLVRLRILNGSNARRYNFGFNDGREFYHIASDGGFLEQASAQTRLLLGPAERAEILVDVSDTGTFRLMSYAVDNWSAFIALASKIIGVVRDEDQAFTVLELRPQVTETQGEVAQNRAIPNRLGTITHLDPSEATQTRRFVFGDDNTINDRKMAIDRIDEVVLLGSTEIWEIFNDTGQHHPFHVHDVQFQIIDRDGVPPLPHEAGWKDTVLVDLHETVRIIMQFTDFADPHIPYMYHCHTLEHEDHGMMGQFVVVANESVQPEVRSEAIEMGLTQDHNH